MSSEQVEKCWTIEDGKRQGSVAVTKPLDYGTFPQFCRILTGPDLIKKMSSHHPEPNSGTVT